jgi:hypothetical protein
VKKIHIQCRQCSITFAIPESAIGKRVRCPKCQNITLVVNEDVPQGKQEAASTRDREEGVSNSVKRRAPSPASGTSSIDSMQPKMTKESEKRPDRIDSQEYTNTQRSNVSTDEWLYQLMGETIGPITSSELLDHVDRRRLDMDTPVKRSKDEYWSELKDSIEEIRQLSGARAAITDSQEQKRSGWPPKSGIAATLAGMLIGGSVVFCIWMTHSFIASSADQVKSIDDSKNVVGNGKIPETLELESVGPAIEPGTASIPKRSVVAPDGFSVDIVKLTVANFPQLVGQSAVYDSEGSYNLGKCTRITLLVRTKQFRIVGVEKNLFRWRIFKYGNEQNLLSDDPDVFQHHQRFTVSKDRTASLVDLYVPSVPADGSGKFRIECDLFLNCGTVSEQKVDGFRLVDGEAISVGDIRLSVVRVSGEVEGIGSAVVSGAIQAGRDLNSNDGLSSSDELTGTLVLKSERPLDALDKITILDQDGIEVTGGVSTRSKFSGGGEIINLGLRKRVLSGTAVIAYLQNVNAIRIPIDFSFTNTLEIE